MVEFPIRKESRKLWDVTTEENSPKFRRALEALRAIRRSFYRDEEWNKKPVKGKYAFQDMLENMLKNPGSYRNDSDYSKLKVALAEIAVNEGEKADTIEEAALMALGVLRRRRGSEEKIEKMTEAKQQKRHMAASKIETIYDQSKSTLRPTPQPGRTPPTRPTQPRGPTGPTPTGPGPQQPPPPSAPTQPQPEPGLICPPELIKVAEWLVRKMPETSFEALWPVFRRQPQIERLIKLKKINPDDQNGIKEDHARACFWNVYREFYESELKLFGGKGGFHPSSGRQLVRKGLGYKVPGRGLLEGKEQTPRYKMIGDPLLRSAINRGRRILRKAARAYYIEMFKGVDVRLDELKKEEDAAKKEYKAADDRLKSLENREKSALDVIGTGEEEASTKAQKEIEALRTASERAKAHFDEAKSKLEKITDEIKKIGDAYDPRNFYNNMMATLSPMVESQSKGLAAALGAGGGTEYWRYGESRSLNAAAEAGLKKDIIQAELLKEAEYLSRYYGRRMMRRITTKLPSMLLGMRNVSMSAQTFGESWTLLLHNIWNLFFGPWTIGTVFVLIQFFFVLAYIGYNVQILWIMPAIGAAITFILNFADSTRPFDWVTHLASGAMIGYSAALLLIVLGAHNWTSIGISGTSSLGFWIAWLIFGFIGLFQFYQTGGFKVVFQGSIVVLLIAYLALGPYQAYFQQAVDQVRAPVEIAYRAVSNAVTDVWLLATDPTEWYARQQLVNVRPEKPLDFPKGIELTSLEALPPSVPAGQQFALTAIIKNDGSIAAKDVILSVGCNQWCKASGADPASYINPKNLDEATKNRLGTDTVNALEGYQAFYVKDKVERGESQIITFSPLAANVFTQSIAQTNLAKVYFNLSYAYSTNSSLQVDVISNDELNRKFREGETVFRQVVAVDKGTPARLSLNVGPQPLKENTDQNILLVSISNTRDESKIILPRGTPVIIRLPKSIGSHLDCGSNTESHLDDNEYEIVTYKIEPSEASKSAVEVLPYEFRSIFAFLCTFKTNSVSTLKTGIVTAELPHYIFRIEQKKDIPVTPPLGIIYDPFEQVCSKCGTTGGITDICDTSECHGLSRGEEKCWYSGYGLTGAVERIGKSVCHSCGTGERRACSIFKTEDTCTKEDEYCRLNCAWIPGGKNPANGADIPGTCVNVSAPISVGSVQGQVIQKITQAASSMKQQGYDDQVKSEGIANSFEEMILKLAWHENRFRHCTDGTLNCIGDTSYSSVICSLPVSDERSSCGVMQIAINKHPEWKTSTNDQQCNGKGAYDADCNIRLGIGLLIQYYNQYGQNGNPDPACTTEPYRSKYISYRGWKAALRAYNGWGCPADYPGGQEAAGNFVENVIGTDVSNILQQALEQKRLSDYSVSSDLDQEWAINYDGQKGAYKIFDFKNYKVRVGVTDGTFGTPDKGAMLRAQIMTGTDQWVIMDCFTGPGYEPYVEYAETNVQKQCQVEDKNIPQPNPSGDDFIIKIDYVNKLGKYVQLTVTTINGLPTFTNAKGQAGYCSYNGPCPEGGGGCIGDGECQNIYAEGNPPNTNPPQRLACRTSLGICCFPGSTDQECISKFNSWKQS